MRCVIQRVSSASVAVDDETIAEIGRGLLVFVAITHTDTATEVEWMAEKVLRLRVFADENNVMNRSVVDVEGEVLVVSQFTLYGSLKKGTRPSYTRSAPGEISEPLYEQFIEKLEEQSLVSVQRGRFGAMMKVNLENDGPVTILLDRETHG